MNGKKSKAVRRLARAVVKELIRRGEPPPKYKYQAVQHGNGTRTVRCMGFRAVYLALKAKQRPGVPVAA